MAGQMEVFLQQETKSFVDLLFKQLESKDYIKEFLENDIPKDSKANSSVADSTTSKPIEIKDAVYKPSKKPTEVKCVIKQMRE